MDVKSENVDSELDQTDDNCGPPTTLTDLPSEIIQKILIFSSLTIQDVCKVSCSSKKMYNCGLQYSNNLWKSKVVQRWPGLLSYNNQTENKVNWKEMCKSCVKTGYLVGYYLNNLDVDHYIAEEIPSEKFNPFICLIEENDISGDIVVSELLSIVHDGQRHKNLTKKYYAVKVLRHIQQLHLSKRWKTFLELPASQQSLETGTCLISQWCQPTEIVTDQNLSNQLDNIVRLVKHELKERKLDHPAISYSSQDNTSGLSQSLWSPKQCRLVLECINFVMFNKLQFKGNKSEYYDPLNSYIDRVLERKKGIPITLSIIYCCLATRLGILCEPVNFPSHFLLRWQEHPLAVSSVERYTYIDAFHGGQLYTHEECCPALGIPESIGHNTSIFDSIDNVKVFERMARNLVGIGRHQNQMGDGLLCLRNALELYLLIYPDDLEMRLLQVRINLHMNINLPQVIDSLQRIADIDPTRLGIVAYLQQEAEKMMADNTAVKNKLKKADVKLRRENKDVKFSIGMIMKHKKYHYMCVIYGWDSTCQATEEWIIQMGVNRLPRDQYQPFYNVLVQDGSNRYAAQENLVYPDEFTEINHPEIGRYFEEFCGRYYKANSVKTQEYPDDTETTVELINEHYTS